MNNIAYTGRDRRMTEMESTFLRESKIRLSDMLKNEPMKKVESKTGKGRGIKIQFRNKN